MFRSQSLISALIVSGSFVSLAGGCSKDGANEKPTAQLGEAIGANIDARGNVPAMSVALALAPGKDPIKYLPKVVSAVSNSVGACPAFIAEEKDGVTGVPFSVNAGKIAPKPVEYLSDGSKCVFGALKDRDIGDATETGFDGRVEIKLAQGAAKAK